MRLIGEATFAAGPAHPEQVFLLDRAAGSTVTLPKAEGTGFRYTFRVGETVTSNSYKIQVSSVDDVFAGVIIGAADVGDTAVGWETAADSDTITLNGTTRGGYVGDVIELIDMKNGVWGVSGVIKQTGTEISPFGAAV